VQKQLSDYKDWVFGNEGEKRLRIGHTGLNYNLSLLGKHTTGICFNCDKRETVEHVLLEFEAYSREKHRLLFIKELGYTQFSVEGLLSFSTLNQPVLVMYLKETDLFDRI